MIDVAHQDTTALAVVPLAHVDVFGPFTMRLASGVDITPRGKRAKGLLALLVLAPHGRRARSWLQDRLWSDKDPEKGRGSLRQELSSLRVHFSAHGLDLISAAGDDVMLDLSAIAVDVLVSRPAAHRELLEGLDVGDPEFENWLSEERAYWYGRLAEQEVAERRTAPVPPVVPPAAASDGRRIGARSLFPHLVLQPFQPVGGDEELSVFTDGLNDELSTVLSAITGTYRILDPIMDSATTADYRLHGSVRGGSGLRVHARVTSLEDGTVLWNERFDIEENLGFVTQEGISRSIVEAIQTALSDGNWADYWTRSETSLRAWELFQKGRVQEGLARKSSLLKAIGYYRRALELDANFMQARISLGLCLIDGLRLCFHADPDAARIEAGQISRMVSAAEPDNLFGQTLAAFYQITTGNFQLARALMTDVVERAPESPEMIAYLAAILGYCGELEREISLCRHALTLTPHPPIWIRTNLVLAQLVRRERDVGPEIEEILAGDSSNLRCHVAQAVHLARSGEIEKAREVGARIRLLQPGFKSECWRSVEFFADPSQHEAIAADLRLAGL